MSYRASSQLLLEQAYTQVNEIALNTPEYRLVLVNSTELAFRPPVPVSFFFNWCMSIGLDLEEEIKDMVANLNSSLTIEVNDKKAIIYFNYGNNLSATKVIGDRRLLSALHRAWQETVGT